MEAAELKQVIAASVTLAELEVKAGTDGALRRFVSSRDELYDLIAPATPDRLFLLDKGASIFRAEWWIGNDDALAHACKEVAAMIASDSVMPLTAVGTSTDERDYTGFAFYLAEAVERIFEA